jgi:hypothetical protein
MLTNHFRLKNFIMRQFVWCMTYKYWISWGDDRAILRVGVFRRMAFHCKILNALISLSSKMSCNTLHLANGYDPLYSPSPLASLDGFSRSHGDGLYVMQLVVAATNQNGDDRAILRVGVFRRMAFHCKILNALICWQNVEESCTFQKIYGLRKDKRKIK